MAGAQTQIERETKKIGWKQRRASHERRHDTTVFIVFGERTRGAVRYQSWCLAGNTYNVILSCHDHDNEYFHNGAWIVLFFSSSKHNFFPCSVRSAARHPSRSGISSAMNSGLLVFFFRNFWHNGAFVIHKWCWRMKRHPFVSLTAHTSRSVLMSPSGGRAHLNTHTRAHARKRGDDHHGCSVFSHAKREAHEGICRVAVEMALWQRNAHRI